MATRLYSLALRLFALALAALAAANALPRAGRFSGDAMIHLAIAERAAAGQWFEFNPGAVTAATTSPAWTALEAALLAVGSFALALPVVSALSFASLLGAAWYVRRVALRLGASPVAASLGALLFASLPGVASNAPLGMENTAFALAALAFIDGVTSPRALRSAPRAASLGALLGLCVLLRPEGTLLALAVVVAARGAAPTALASLAIVAALTVAPAVFAHWHITHHWLPASGFSRVMAARRDGLSRHLLGPLWIYPATLARLVVHLPLVGFACAGSPADEHRTTRRALLVVLVAGFGLYTFGTGAAHVARLTQWLFALLAVLAAVGISRRLATASRWLAVACVAQLALVGAETLVRRRDIARANPGLTRATLLRAIDRRAAGTDRLLRGLCEGGCCRPGLTPSIAVVEVQRRLSLDARVSVTSLDGVTSSTVTFDALTGCPRLDPLLADPAVLGLLEDPRAQLARCLTSPVARSLAAAWERPAAAPDGWLWSAALHGLVRRCGPAPQPSAASSSASASSRVARRTASLPTAP